MKVLTKLSQLILEKERKTKAYKETMSQDISNIDTYETRKNVHTKKWRPIYEVIDEAYIKDSKILSEDLSDNVKNIQT